MTHIHVHGPALAEITVVVTPRWWRRFFLRERPRTITRFVVFGLCGHWHYEDTGDLVASNRLVAVLTAAQRIVRPQRQAASSGVSPPN